MTACAGVSADVMQASVPHAHAACTPTDSNLMHVLTTALLHLEPLGSQKHIAGHLPTVSEHITAPLHLDDARSFGRGKGRHLFPASLAPLSTFLASLHEPRVSVTWRREVLQLGFDILLIVEEKRRLFWCAVFRWVAFLWPLVARRARVVLSVHLRELVNGDPVVVTIVLFEDDDLVDALIVSSTAR